MFKYSRVLSLALESVDDALSPAASHHAVPGIQPVNGLNVVAHKAKLPN